MADKAQTDSEQTAKKEQTDSKHTVYTGARASGKGRPPCKQRAEGQQTNSKQTANKQQANSEETSNKQQTKSKQTAFVLLLRSRFGFRFAFAWLSSHAFRSFCQSRFNRCWQPWASPFRPLSLPFALFRSLLAPVRSILVSIGPLLAPFG